MAIPAHSKRAGHESGRASVQPVRERRGKVYFSDLWFGLPFSGTRELGEGVLVTIHSHVKTTISRIKEGERYGSRKCKSLRCIEYAVTKKEIRVLGSPSMSQKSKTYEMNQKQEIEFSLSFWRLKT